jgi:hypothetical protein
LRGIRLFEVLRWFLAHGTIFTTSTNVFINITAATGKDDTVACGATISSGAAT